MDHMAFCYLASAASLGSYLTTATTPSHSKYRITFISLSEPGFVLTLDFHVVLEHYFGIQPLPPISSSRKGKSSRFLSCQSYILSQMSLSQQPHKVDTFIITRHRTFKKLPKITQLINGRASSKPRQFGSRILHLH